MYRIVLYPSASGRFPVREFLDRLPEKNQAKIAAALDYLAQLGSELRRPHAAHVRGKLWELRVSRARSEYRLLYYFRKREVVVVLHGILKKRQALPNKEIETAEGRMTDYENRVARGEIEP